MTTGYKSKGLPDTEWWMTQIYAGIRFRDKFAHKDHWAQWRDYYRGEWAAGVLPQNLFFSLLRTIVPRVYFRNPAVSVTPAKPGFDNIALAQVLGRVDNKMMKQMNVKREMKKIAQDAFLFGTAFGKLGFGALYTPTPDDFGTSPPVSKKGQTSLEYRAGMTQNMPWFARIHPGNAIVPAMTEDFETARWFAHWDRRTPEDLMTDPRFKNTKDINAVSVPEVTHPSYVLDGMPLEMVDIVEIRDKKTQEVMVLAPNQEGDATVLYNGHDDLQYDNNIPIFPVVFNTDDEVFWGVSDSIILEPQQLEINEIKTQIMKRRRAALNRIFAQKGAIDEDEVAKIFGEDSDGVVFTNKDPNSAISKVEVGDIPDSLLVAKQQILQDVREGLGFSRNEFGEFKPGSRSPTATETMVVKMASELRIDERRDVMADVLVDLMNGMHRIIFKHWTEEQVEQVVGPGGVPVWIKFRGADLSAGNYEVKVDPDSSLPETRQLREERAAQLYTLLKENPLIDPQKLTQYLLTELKGVQFDDLMQVLPAPEAASGDAINPQQFSQLIQGQFAEMQTRGGPQGGPPGKSNVTPIKSGTGAQ